MAPRHRWVSGWRRRQHAAGWRSQNGRNWEQIASQNPFYTEGYSVVDLVSGDAGLLALTHGFAERSGGVWLWTPKASWQEVTPEMPATSAGAVFPGAAWANGRYVVVGDGSHGGNRDALDLDVQRRPDLGGHHRTVPVGLAVT